MAAVACRGTLFCNLLVSIPRDGTRGFWPVSGAVCPALPFFAWVVRLGCDLCNQLVEGVGRNLEYVCSCLADNHLTYKARAPSVQSHPELPPTTPTLNRAQFLWVDTPSFELWRTEKLTRPPGTQTTVKPTQNQLHTVTLLAPLPLLRTPAFLIGLVFVITITTIVTIIFITEILQKNHLPQNGYVFARK